MVAARRQQQWRRKLGLQCLAAVAVERRQQRQDNNDGGKAQLGLAKMAERQQKNSEIAVTAISVAQIWICGKGCGNIAATAVTTWWQRKLVWRYRHQHQWQRQYFSNSAGANLVYRTWRKWQQRAAAKSRQERWQQNKLGLAATVGRQKFNSEIAVTATAVAQIWIC